MHTMMKQTRLFLALFAILLAGFASYVGNTSAHTSTSVIPEACKNGATVEDGVVVVTGERYHCATGVNNTVRFSITVAAGKQGVIATYGAGCVEGGIFLGLAEGTSIDIAVTDGMVQIAAPNNAAVIFREQVQKSLEMDEAVGYVQPLDEWGYADMDTGGAAEDLDIVNDLLANCGEDSELISHLSVDQDCLYGCDLDGDGVDDMLDKGSGGAPDGVRTESGIGEDLSFEAHTPVVGTDIALSDGTTHSECYLADPPLGGTVNTGVIWPNAEEIEQATAC